MLMTLFPSVMLSLVLAAQSPAAAEAQKTADASAERLAFMKESVQIYELTAGTDRPVTLKLQTKPVFRLGKQQADNLEDGAIFLWTGEQDRPEAAIQVFRIKDEYEPNGLWIQEFTSLADTGITATRDGQPWWTPREPGLELKSFPDAPKPAGGAAQRLRQMRSLADGFRASDNFKRKGWSELRLLPTPITRYGKAGTPLIDGALFAFVLGTDPEVFLFIEERAGKKGPEWQYALAPMTVYAVKGWYHKDLVWELPDRFPSYNPTKPFYDKSYEVTTQGRR
jgi:hypothetical protein